MESVAEMQMMCILFFYFLEQNYESKIEGGLHSLDTALYILGALFAEHIFSYTTGYFRKWEIEHYGKLDVNGIMRAQKESFLATAEIFIDCLIMGYSLNFFYNMSREDFNSHPYYMLWIIIDCIIMFLSLPYTYLT